MDYKHLGEGDIPVYGTGGYMLSIDKALSEDKDAIGIGRKGTIDKPYILRAPFWTVDTLFYCIPKAGYDLDFTSCLFQNVDWKKKDESTGVPSLSKVIINNVGTVAPAFDEQKKIGEYFSNLDTLITLHQRKNNYKKQKWTYVWEQRKLGDVTQRVQGNDGRMDLPTLTISAANGWLDQRDRFSSNIAGSEQKNYTLLHKGELSYNHGNSKLAKYGTVFALRTYDEALVPRVYHSFKATEEANADFIEYVFATKLPDRELGKLISSGARMDGLLNINYEEFMSINMMLPSIEEQLRISEYLRKVDTLITLHQCKFEKNAKSQLNDWEQRKLNEIAEKVTEKNRDNLYDEPFTNSAEQGIISQKDYFDREVVNEENLDGYYVVRDDDFVYNPRVSVSAPVGPINRNKLGRNGVMSPLYTVFRTHDINTAYLEHYFKTQYWHMFMKMNGDSGARFDRFSIATSLFMEMPIPYPSVGEQVKIGAYFDSLDILITLHQCKCYKKYEDAFFAWEQRKLGEVFRERTERANGDEELLSVTIGSGVIRQADSDKRNIASEDKSNYKAVRKGDVPYNSMRMWQGAVGISEYDGIVSPAYTVLEPIDNTNGKFFMELFKKETSLQIFQRWSQGLTSDTWNLKYPALSTIEFYVPPVEEQEQIADYFQQMDNLITLHQRKCEETKMLKKFMLQKMFPKDGESVPEIRFSGFTDAWEQRKLGEITDRITRKNQDLVSTLPLTISAQYGLIDQNEFFDKRVASKDVSGYYLVNNGEFAYNKSTSSDAPWGAIKRLDRYENGVLSTLYIVFAIKDESQIDSDYLVSYYDTDLWHRGVREIAAEGARNHGLLNITPADFFETSLAVPQDIEEQKAIGKFFTELNALITLHQRKCEELQNIKKFMLQNMFAS